MKNKTNYLELLNNFINIDYAKVSPGFKINKLALYADTSNDFEDLTINIRNMFDENDAYYYYRYTIIPAALSPDVLYGSLCILHTTISYDDMLAFTKMNPDWSLMTKSINYFDKYKFDNSDKGIITVDEYNEAMKKFDSMFDDNFLRDLTQEEIQRQYEHLKDNIELWGDHVVYGKNYTNSNFTDELPTINERASKGEYPKMIFISIVKDKNYTTVSDVYGNVSYIDARHALTDINIHLTAELIETDKCDSGYKFLFKHDLTHYTAVEIDAINNASEDICYSHYL